VVFEGEIPESLRAMVQGLYRWIADDRYPRPTVDEELLAYISAADVPVSPWRTVRAVTAELPTEEAVGIVHVDRDLLFVADEGAGWDLVGASIGGTVLWLGADPKFLLVLGSDARPGQSQTRLRADSIHILALSPTLDAGTIVGFPRDAYVTKEIIDAANERVGLTNLPAGSIKWTNLMASRGPEIMLETAREMTGLPISGYVVTGFVGFESLIRAIGSITVDLPRSIASGREDTPGFRSGVQRLNAERALLLARIRKTIAGGDFARSLNQGMIILAGMVAVQNRGIDALPDLLHILHKYAWTDLPAGELLALGAAGLIMSPDGLENLVLPGVIRTISGSSVVLLDEEELNRVISGIADDGVLDPLSAGDD
jgi:LCP family protein required for cell wall assembly